jgi:hypothetical protein
MVYNTTFNNISVIYIVAVSLIGGGNRSTQSKPSWLCVLRPMLHDMSLDCPLLIVPSVFTDVYFRFIIAGADPRGGGRTRRSPPPPKIGKKYDFLA